MNIVNRRCVNITYQIRREVYRPLIAIHVYIDVIHFFLASVRLTDICEDLHGEVLLHVAHEVGVELLRVHWVGVQNYVSP